jgi:hypothetical protein
MPTTTVARVRSVFTGVAGSPAYVNTYFDADSTSAGAYQAAMLIFWGDLQNAIRADANVEMLNPIPIVSSLTGQVVDVAVGDGGTVDFADSADPLPTANQLLVQLHTGVFVGGREIRGRMFIPYMTEAANTGGKTTSAAKNAVTDALDDMNDISHANGAFVVYSPTHHRFEYVSGYTVWDQWAVMRSRRD